MTSIVLGLGVRVRVTDGKGAGDVLAEPSGVENADGELDSDTEAVADGEGVLDGGTHVTVVTISMSVPRNRVPLRSATDSAGAFCGGNNSDPMENT
jgi:hypothetical protein